jgi:hypothetical protein
MACLVCVLLTLPSCAFLRERKALQHAGELPARPVTDDELVAALKRGTPLY